MMTQAQALGDIQYNNVNLGSKPKVKTAYDPPMWTKSRNSRYIGCLLKAFKIDKQNKIDTAIEKWRKKKS